MARVGVLKKIAALLDVLSTAGKPPSVAELSRVLGMPRATVHRLLRALGEEGLVEVRQGRFFPGFRLLQWASQAWEGSDLRRVAHPILLRLAKETGETATIFIRVGHQRICLDRVEGPGILRTTIPIGSANPLHLGRGCRPCCCRSASVS